MYFHPLNFIRFILALGVVLFHYGISYYPFDHGALNTLIVNSSFRVSFFFFISGFVLMLVYGGQGADLRPATFYMKRLTRILPMFWLAFIATLVLLVTVKDAGPKGLVIALHFLGLQSVYPGYVLDLNYPAWSISVELFFYAVFPFLLRWMHQVEMKKLVIVTLGLWVLQCAQHVVFVDYLYDGTKAMEEFISDFPLWHLTTFIGGMTCAKIILFNYTTMKVQRLATLLFTASILMIAYIVIVPNPFLKYAHNGLLTPLFGLLIISLFYDRSAIHRFLSQPAISKLGDLSYGLFIFQYPVWIACVACVDGEFTTRASFFLVYLAVLLLFSWLVNRYVEAPLLKVLRRKYINGTR